MTNLYALILVVYVQGASSLDPYIARFDVVNTPQISLEACNTSGQLLIGPIAAETDSNVKYTWQDFKCVSLENK